MGVGCWVSAVEMRGRGQSICGAILTAAELARTHEMAHRTHVNVCTCTCVHTIRHLLETDARCTMRMPNTLQDARRYVPEFCSGKAHTENVFAYCNLCEGARQGSTLLQFDSIIRRIDCQSGLWSRLKFERLYLLLILVNNSQFDLDSSYFTWSQLCNGGRIPLLNSNRTFL